MKNTATLPRAIGLLMMCALVQPAHSAEAGSPQACAQPVYLTVAPGHMEFAPQVADILRRQQVTATFFASNLSTRNGGGSLGEQWGSWWKVIAQQGHEFASQTYDHVVWRGDVAGYKPAFRMKPESGAFAGREFTFDPPKYCEQIGHAADRIAYYTGKKPLPLFHAPAGKVSSKLLAAASACGYAYVGATGAGHLVGSLSVRSAAADIRAGDVLLVDLETSASAKPWAVDNLEALIVGLKERGLCFESLRKHPVFKDWIANHGG
ncbi:polysaccharide deacetylase family protein [Rhodoferax sp. GW822-FHT02A01]|uniref:polysaccharide deacetylase family protein n=1 Tax=Rhodoferax sp. GW822-FHT02A01 TaxID=3141537 RepID=UPI00315D46EF